MASTMLLSSFPFSVNGTSILSRASENNYFLHSQHLICLQIFLLPVSTFWHPLAFHHDLSHSPLWLGLLGQPVTSPHLFSLAPLLSSPAWSPDWNTPQIMPFLPPLCRGGRCQLTKNSHTLTLTLKTLHYQVPGPVWPHSASASPTGFLFLRDSFINLFECLSVCLLVWAPSACSGHGGQKGALDPLELQSQGVMSSWRGSWGPNLGHLQPQEVL